MDRYATFTRPEPLQHDAAIYWLDSAVFAEYAVSLLRHERDRWAARSVVDAELRRAIAAEAPWAHYSTTDETRDDAERDIRFHRRVAYEQPGYREVTRWRAPSSLMDLRLPAKGHEVVTLPLRRLSYHGEVVRAALHDGVLHVIFP